MRAERPDRAGSGPDEFARMLRASTVDVRAVPRRRRGPGLGKLALVFAIVSVAIDGSAFAVFMGGDIRFAGGICLVTVFVTFVAAVLGFVAAVGGMGRWYGVGAVVLAFVANPVVLVFVVTVVAPELAPQFGM